MSSNTVSLHEVLAGAVPFSKTTISIHDLYCFKAALVSLSCCGLSKISHNWCVRSGINISSKLFPSLCLKYSYKVKNLRFLARIQEKSIYTPCCSSKDDFKMNYFRDI